MQKQIRSILLCTLCSFLFSSTVESVVYVDINATPGGNGTTWCTAYNAVQDGLDEADILNEEVWVAEGIYLEHITLKGEVGLFGGFTGCGELEEIHRSQRDWRNNLTIIDGSDSGRVVVGAENSTIDGFTIQNGNAENGGGMYNESVDVSINNCNFIGNMAYNGGGGAMYNHNSVVSISKCDFTGNMTDSNSGSRGGSGAGISNNNSTVTITSCNFQGNSAWGWDFDSPFDGGAIANYSSSSVAMNDCDFMSNMARDFGGGVYNHASSLIASNCSFIGNIVLNQNGGGISNHSSSCAEITNCLFSEHYAEGFGGVIDNDTSVLTVIDCSFIRNEADIGPGAIRNYFDSSATISGSLFLQNVGLAGGVGGISNWNTSTLNINNCIFWANFGTDGGIDNSGSLNINSSTFSGNFGFSNYNPASGIYNDGTMNITNSVLWKDINYNYNPEIDRVPEIYNIGTSTISNCDIEQSGGSGSGWNNSLGIDGGGNIDSDPLFYKEYLAVDYVGGLEITVDGVTNFRSGDIILITDGIFTAGDLVVSSINDTITIMNGFSSYLYPSYLVTDGAYVYDFHLRNSSPCIDAGTDVGTLDNDIEGEFRPFDVPGVDNNGEFPEFDMGADEFVDTDSDAVPDYTDNCIIRYNTTQADSDADGIGDSCDLDDICIDFNPDTLNKASCGNWVAVYIELPEGYDPADIDSSTILLNDEIAPVLDSQYGFVTDEESYLVDKVCLSGVMERMVKFERKAVAEILPVGNEVNVTITGELNDGTSFQGIEIIGVMDRGQCKGDFDIDNDIDGVDANKIKKEFGRNKFNRPCKDEDICNGDFDCDGDCDGGDAATFKEDFGRNVYTNSCPPPF